MLNCCRLTGKYHHPYHHIAFYSLPRPHRESPVAPRCCLAATVPAVVRDELQLVEAGNVAVIVPRSLQLLVQEALETAGIEFGGATRSGLEKQVTVVPVPLVKGLEVDSAVVVEPGRIVAEESQGMRSLYVALTRATKRVGVVHAEALPSPLR